MVNEISKRIRCFIIQPFGTKGSSNGEKFNNDEIYKSLKELELADPTFPIEIYRADTEKIKNEDLHSHVTDCIKESDFCIADVNGQNPNVLYELGYARGIGKETIVLCQNREELPGDMDGHIYVEYNANDINDLHAKIYPHFDRVKKGLYRVFEDALEKVSYLPKRDDNLIRKKLINAKSKIDILQTNLSILSNEFIDDILKALENNVSLDIRILTLDPQSIFVNFRAHQLEYDEVGIFRDQLDNALENISYKLREYSQHVRIKTYDDFPTQIAFHIDDEILSCVVSATGRSRDNCAFLLPDTILGAKRSFLEHFEGLWNSDKSKGYGSRYKSKEHETSDELELA